MAEAFAIVRNCVHQASPRYNRSQDGPGKGALIREGIPSLINPTDVNVVEECLKLKDQFGSRLAVMTMGPPQAEEALRDLLAMGADRAVLLTDRAMAGADTYATSYTLSAAVRWLEKD